MADGLKDIIKRLEQQGKAIERALSALREVDGSIREASVPGDSGPKKRAKRKGGMTPEGRKRLSESLKQRWAAKRAAAENGGTAKKATAKKRGRKPRSAAE